MRTKPLPETFAYGIDIGKKVFHVVAVNREGAVIQRAKFARETLQSFFDLAPKTLIGMEACPGSQWLARRLNEMGHDARIIPARFVKPYVKSNKSDAVDAAAIAEAVTRPTMHYPAAVCAQTARGRFVAVRTPEQVDLQALHRIRDRLVGQRTGLMNQARAFCIEYGLAMRVGAGGFHADIRQHLGNQDNDLTQNMRGLLNDRSDDLAYIENRVKALSAKIEAIAKEDEMICRLLSVPGIGPLGATALVAAAGDGKQFRKARDMAAWPRLVPAEYSTGGKQTLLGIVARGNGYVRRLITPRLAICGARSCFLHLNRGSHALGRWPNALKHRAFNLSHIVLRRSNSSIPAV